LNADDLVEGLSISRSNVSMGLKELQSWRLIKPIHFAGDRKEYYETPDDIWEVARIIYEPVSEEGHYAHKKMLEIHDMIDMTTSWADQLQQISNKDLIKLMKLGTSVTKLVGVKNKLTGKNKNAD